MSGFLSTSFDQPLGGRVADAAVEGYYIDMSVKSRTPTWPPPELLPLERRLWVGVAQWGLGAYERYLAGQGDAWLEAARRAGQHLLEFQDQDGAWLHREPYPHTFRVDPPWPSAMAQGEAASLLTRLHVATGDDRFADSARRALAPYDVSVAEGGVRAELCGGPFYEEYPTDPPSMVLNGGIFALWGLRDVGIALGEKAVSERFEEGVDVLAEAIDRWDTGWWSLYDLQPRRLRNVASLAYHELHVAQLRAMCVVAPRPPFEGALARFERYWASHSSRARALAAKAAFRLAVPRGRRA